MLTDIMNNLVISGGACRRKVYMYQIRNFESVSKKFAKDNYINYFDGYADSQSF